MARAGNDTHRGSAGPRPRNTAEARPDVRVLAGSASRRTRSGPNATPAAVPAVRGPRAAGLDVLLSLIVLAAVWQSAVMLIEPPRFILPSPMDVARAFAASWERLLAEGAITLGETLAGLASGIVLGFVTGLAVAVSPLAGRLVTPLLVASQALPVFALAPLLVLWFGFGVASKIVMASLVIYFPVASSLADGLQRTDPGLLDLARLSGAGRWPTLRLVRLPSALPALVSGIRVAAVFAPIGAVIGEWVGAARGLGLLMVQANARMQTDLLFAALVLLALFSLVLKAVVDRLTRRLIPWAEEP